MVSFPALNINDPIGCRWYETKIVKSKGLTIDDESYPGPTYIAIRSAKHSVFLTFDHLRDVNRVHSLSELTDSFQSKSSKDENPRYNNTIDCAIGYFNEHDIDAYFVATKAHERAFNQVERRIPNLSKKLESVILSHDKECWTYWWSSIRILVQNGYQRLFCSCWLCWERAIRHHVGRMERQSHPWVAIPFTNYQMRWHSVLLSIPIVITKNNEEHLPATSLTCSLFFNRNQVDKR